MQLKTYALAALTQPSSAASTRSLVLSITWAFAQLPCCHRMGSAVLLTIAAMATFVPKAAWSCSCSGGDEKGLKSTKYYGDIVASAMNSDGKTSGVALPSSEQQAHCCSPCMRPPGSIPIGWRSSKPTAPAHSSAIRPKQVPSAVSRHHRNAPLPIGSAKSNVGHLEPASGIVGLLKAQLALEHGLLPRSLHVEKLNPHIPFDELNLTLQSTRSRSNRRPRPLRWRE